MTSVTFAKIYGWHIPKDIDRGLGRQGVGCLVISYRRSWIALSCHVKKTCDWMVYVFNVVGISSITVNLGKTTKAIKLSQRPYLCVGCVHNNALIKYL